MVKQSRFRHEVLGRALDERVEQIHLLPTESGADVVFIRGDERQIVTALDAETLQQVHDDIVFRLTAGGGCLYARRNDDEFALTASVSEGEDLILLIASQEKVG